MLDAVQAGELLRAARLRAGLSQAELARRGGTSQPVVSAYEHGRRDPSVETLRRMVRASGSTLYIGLRPETDWQPLTPEERSARLVDVLRLADAIPYRARGDLAFPHMSSR